MKIKSFLAVAALALASFTVNAQTAFKIGYTNVDVLLGNMPEAKTIEAELKNKSAQYEKLIQEKRTQYETLIKDFQTNEKTMSEVIKTDKVKQIQSLEAGIQEFGQNAQADMQKKQSELLQPVLTKIQDAINAVGKEAGYAYILNTAADASSTPLLLYADPQYDITEAVAKKLNITIKPAQPAPAPAAPKK